MPDIKKLDQVYVSNARLVGKRDRSQTVEAGWMNAQVADRNFFSKIETCRKWSVLSEHPTPQLLLSIIVKIL